MVEQHDDRTDTGTVVAGEVLAAVSREMVRLHKEAYGRGPTRARSFIDGNVLVCLLEGGFHDIDRTLLEHGRGDIVVNQREALQEALREDLIKAVEDLAGRKVRAFISGVDAVSECASEVFVLEADLGDERQATRAWGEQTRRQARVLRAAHRELSDESSRLTEESRARRRPDDVA
jgi:uncharacterized protein YbcI